MTPSLARRPDRACYQGRGEGASLPPANTGPAVRREAGWHLRPGPPRPGLVLFHAVPGGVPRTERPRSGWAPRRVSRRYPMPLNRRDGLDAVHLGVACRRREVVGALLPARPRL